jgi:hypothetical protein
MFLRTELFITTALRTLNPSRTKTLILTACYIDSYESVPIQELTTSLCNLLALVHPEDGGDTILRNVGIRATRCHFPEDDNHQKI